MSIAGIARLALNLLKGPRMLNPGDAAPDIDATDQNGRPVRLKDLRGKKVVLWFYPKANTGG